MSDAHPIGRTAPGAAACFSLVALVLLGTRFVQGFIFWGGASRRLLYNFHEIDGVAVATKLDFDSAGFVANKLTHALPGTLWIQGPLEWTLQYPDLIIASVWTWTLAELVVGLGLILGLATRLAAAVSIGINIALMLIFGWMGSTCLDEWTMAVSGVAMSSAIFLAGGGLWSLDRFVGRSQWAARNVWSSWVFSGPLPSPAVERLSIVLAALVIVFTVGSYHILFRAVVSEQRARVSFHKHNVALSDVKVAEDGRVTFKAYVDAGPDTGAAYIIAARLLDRSGATIAEWNGETLAALPDTAIRNLYPYIWASHFKTEKVGFSGQTGARATITLPSQQTLRAARSLVLESITGTVWRAQTDAAP